MGVEIWRLKSYWVVSAVSPETIPQKRFESDIPPLSGPPRPDWENELLLLNVWKRRPYRIKITGKKRQSHLATSERAGARAGTGWGGLCTHIPGTFLIITVNGIPRCLSGVRFPLEMPTPVSGGSRAPTKHSLTHCWQSCYATEGPLKKKSSDLDFQSIQSCIFHKKISKRQARIKWRIPSTLTYVYNKLQREKNRIIFKQPTLLFSLFSVGMFTQFKMDWSDNEQLSTWPRLLSLLSCIPIWLSNLRCF